MTSIQNLVDMLRVPYYSIRNNQSLFTQRILKYLPLMLGYFSLSVPAGLGVYWITNSVLSTVTTAGIKEYFKRNPMMVSSSTFASVIAWSGIL